MSDSPRRLDKKFIQKNQISKISVILYKKGERFYKKARILPWAKKRYPPLTGSEALSEEIPAGD